MICKRNLIQIRACLSLERNKLTRKIENRYKDLLMLRNSSNEYAFHSRSLEFPISINCNNSFIARHNQFQTYSRTGVVQQLS